MSTYTNGWNVQHLASYRVLLKRTLRRAVRIVDNETPTEGLELMIVELAKRAPKIVADSLADRYTQAAKAWEKGNNSGDSETLEAEYVNCDRLRDSADAVLFLFSVKTDFPGLYPTFTWQGQVYYTAESVLFAWAEWANFQEGK